MAAQTDTQRPHGCDLPSTAKHRRASAYNGRNGLRNGRNGPRTERNGDPITAHKCVSMFRCVDNYMFEEYNDIGIPCVHVC
jgi:hypothetical protein